jgi:hypothetical protein
VRETARLLTRSCLSGFLRISSKARFSSGAISTTGKHPTLRRKRARAIAKSVTSKKFLE